MECGVSGEGALTDPENWVVQIFRCGTTPCVDGINLPLGYQSGQPDCVNATLDGSGGVQPPCDLHPVGEWRCLGGQHGAAAWACMAGPFVWRCYLPSASSISAAGCYSWPDHHGACRPRELHGIPRQR